MTEEIQKKLKNFKGLILDGDGVLFTGQESRSVLPSGEVVVTKTRHLHDGQGLSFLRALDISVVFATGENAVIKSIVEKINNLSSVKSGNWKEVEFFTDQLEAGGKVAALELWQKKYNLTWSDCAYIGDDRTDFEAMSLAGLKVVPNNARRIVKNIADVILSSEGGNGAIREFAEMTLDARGIDETSLPTA